MKLNCTPVGRRCEILASDDFQSVPVVIAGSSAVKAGIPVKADGTAVPAGTGAAGILLYDADPNVNPNAAMVVQGVVNWTRCRENGASAEASAMSAILPGIVFRENVGAAEAASDTAGGGSSGGGTSEGGGASDSGKTTGSDQ